MIAKEIFNKYGAVHLKEVISKDTANFLTNVFLLSKEAYPNTDDQVLNSQVLSHNFLFDAILEKVWPDLELVLEEELIPTYSYGRLYENGHVLERHTDRPSCEVSITIQLGRSHHYSWPIYMGGQRYDLGEGDGVVYKGCDIPHWRDKCDGPEGYYSGQIFLHYVRANGPHAEYAGDKRWKNHPFKRNRGFVMEQK